MWSSLAFLLWSAFAFDDFCVNHFYKHPNQCEYDDPTIPTSTHDYMIRREYLTKIVENSIYQTEGFSSSEEKLQTLLEKWVSELKTPTYNPTGHNFYDIKVS